MEDKAAALALTASAGPMRLTTAVEVSANAARRWRDQYRHWNDEDTFADGLSKRQVSDSLNHVGVHSPDNITRILNIGWAKPQCDCCGSYTDAVVTLANHFDADVPAFRICITCATAARGLLDRAHAVANHSDTQTVKP